MAKSGLIERKKRTHPTLTKEIASALINKIQSGEVLFTKEEYKENKSVEIPLQNGVFMLKPYTYNSWVKRRTLVPDTKKTLYSLVMQAKHHRRMKRHELAQEVLVANAQEYLAKLQALPLGTVTKKRNSKKGNNARDGDYWEKSADITETPINPSMVGQKRQGAEFVLSRLDPRYAEKKENKNLNIVVSLKDLRKAAEAKKSIQQPHE